MLLRKLRHRQRYADEDTLLGTYEDSNGFNKFIANNLFENSDNNGIEDIDNALSYDSSSSQDKSLNEELFNSFDGNNEEVVIVNTPGSIQGGGGSGATSVYLIMLMIFMGLCRRINMFVDKVAIFVHKLQSIPVG